MGVPLQKSDETAESVTCLLIDVKSGEGETWNRIYTLLYRELHGLARSQLWQSPHHTLSPTALVNETWIKLASANINAENRRQLIGLVVSTMRSVLLDEAKRKLAKKRGGDMQVLSLSDGWDSDGEYSGRECRLEHLVALDAALNELQEAMPRLAQVVEWRYFGGLGEEEIARLLGIHVRTVRRDWKTARQFLLQRLGDA
ncbi:ECF-type sigma factor [Luteimonas sp. R10]|uniref:ECF-type sigma factor n=1 Tax=Luteimonas sp. R10 TaxID=3108176 RepID=UPI00308E66E3|nr:ECF-type sigma factor [Luteimonas sp. R10]